MTIKYKFYLSIIFVVLSLSSVSAQTLIAGKIYNADYSSIISGASVTVTCNSDSLSTTSINDGTYAVRFEQADCSISSNVHVASEKGKLIGSGSGTISECDNEECNGDPFTIVNLAMKTKQADYSSYTAHGSSTKVYMCGNGKCDSGETANTCAEDCKAQTIIKADNSAASITPEETNSMGTNETIQLAGRPGSFSRITGAFAEGLSSPKIIAAVIILVALIIFLISIVAIRRNK